jgi:cyanophycin synthetase
VAHLGRSAGRHVGRAGSDGIFVDGLLVDAADQSGSAGRLLMRPEVDLAVTEAAHSTILLGGLGVTHNDVSVVTNVADIVTDAVTKGVGDVPEVETADRLAEVKAVVARITRSDGWCVLNGDDPRVWAMRSLSPARPWVFSCDSDSPAVREALDDGARATTVVDDWFCVLESGHDPDPLVRVADVPMTGTDPETYAVLNVLAAASAGLAVGLPATAVVTGLESFAS